MDVKKLSNEELTKIIAEAKRELMKIPGVVKVGFGTKWSDGVMTDKVAIRVYVSEKRPLSEIPPEERIPTEFQGLPTDVMLVPGGTEGASCHNLTKYDTLVGGCHVTNFIQDPSHTEPFFFGGTLGCFATINAEGGRDKYALLSNSHVLTKFGATAGQAIYQPPRTSDGADGWSYNIANAGGAVANLNGTSGYNNFPFTYPTESEDQFYVDAAFAKLRTNFSSWCDTNCGTHFINELAGLNLGGSNAIAGVARATAADVASGTYKVYKVGARTGKTEGLLTAIDVDPHNNDNGIDMQNMIEITFSGTNCEGTHQFFAHGDSGSVLLNENREVVGLVTIVGGTETLSYACHIHPVLHLLGITLVTEASLPAASSRIIQNVPGQFRDPVALLRGPLRQDDEGKAILEALQCHREELVHLVNRHRPVTLAWQRGHGPAYMMHYLEAMRDPNHRVPEELHGIDRKSAFARLLDSLEEAGSPGLRRDVGRFRDRLLHEIALRDSFADLLEHHLI